MKSALAAGALICAVQLIPPFLKASETFQIQSTTAPSFEAATIKPSPPGLPVTLVGGSCHGTDSHGYPTDYTMPPLGRCIYTNVTLTDLLSIAYAPAASNGLRAKVTGGPSWVASEPWDIQAKADNPDAVTEFDLKRMLQVLIAERFKLQFHPDTKDVQGFALVVGRDGPKFTEDHSDAPQRMYFDGRNATFQNSFLADFASFLSGPVGAPVLDKTGLTLSYRFAFHIPPRQTGDIDSPSIFTAVQEQLGLRLESAKVPLEVLVIDHVEKPNAN